MADSPAPRNDVFTWLGDRARDWWPYVLNTLAIVGFGIQGAADMNGHIAIPIVGWTWAKTAVIWVSAIFAVLGSLGILRRRQQLTAVRESLARAEGRAGATERALKGLIQTELGILCKTLDHYSSERVTLFVHRDGGFKLVGRLSRNPALNIASRGVYPENEGCVGTAWETGSTFVTDLPDPQADYAGWAAAQTDLGVPAARVPLLTMRSRMYAAFRIEAAGPGQMPLGVIIFESQLLPGSSAARLHEPDLDSAIKGAEGHRLCFYLTEMAEFAAAV
jgi:hypothetical protein